MGHPCQECERLNLIEASLNGGGLDPNDALWLVFQLRNWQLFAKRIVDFEDVLRAERVSPAVFEGYERIFTGYASQPR